MQPIQSLACAGLLALTLGGTGCANTSPVLNIENAPVYQNEGTLTLTQVRDKIAAGLAAKRWGIEDESQGWIVAKVTAGGHWAKVRITYDTKTYTIIHFASSPGLKWDGNRIHRRYNNWITLVDAQIRKQFTLPPDSASAEPPADPAAVTPDAVVDSDGAPPSDDGTPAEATPDTPPTDGPAPDPSWNDPEAP